MTVGGRHGEQGGRARSACGRLRRVRQDGHAPYGGARKGRRGAQRRAQKRGEAQVRRPAVLLCGICARFARRTQHRHVRGTARRILRAAGGYGKILCGCDRALRLR